MRHPYRSPTWRAAAARQVANLSRRSDSELLDIWKNVVRGINGRRDAAAPGPLLKMRDALEIEWELRAQRSSGEEWFRWPTTKVNIGPGSLSAAGWPEEGVLAALGYHVGATAGRAEPERRWLLDHAFSRTLPAINSPAYMAEWGKPATAGRLKKLAHTLAAFLRNGKHRYSASWSLACDQWDSDLEYLHGKYYVLHFRFGWPVKEAAAQEKAAALKKEAALKKAAALKKEAPLKKAAVPKKAIGKPKPTAPARKMRSAPSRVTPKPPPTRGEIEGEELRRRIIMRQKEEGPRPPPVVERRKLHPRRP